MRLALQGASGSGKTYSSLLIAHGMTSDWSKIAVIDTENGSADLYAHLGAYNVLSLSEPYNPEKYIDAIGITCWISTPTCKGTPSPTGPRLRPGRTPLSSGFSTPRAM